jgi:biopolymer transport protein ExbB
VIGLESGLQLLQALEQTLPGTLVLAQSAADAANTAASAAAQPDAAAQSKSLLEYIQSGGVISYILILLSIAAVGLIITSLLQLRKSALAPDSIVEQLERLLRDRHVDQAMAFCAQPANACFLTRVLGAGLLKASRSTFGMLELRPALETAGQKEVERLDKLNHWIAMIAALGPMLGLLGTVIGIIGAFETLGQATGAARSAGLAKFMSLALVTTAEGLIVAIPCTIAHAVFKRRVDRLATDVSEIIESLTAPLQPGAQAAKAAPRAPARPAAAPLSPANVA